MLSGSGTQRWFTHSLTHYLCCAVAGLHATAQVPLQHSKARSTRVYQLTPPPPRPMYIYVLAPPGALPHCSTTKPLTGAPGCAAPLLPLLYWRPDGRTALLLYCLPTVHCARCCYWRRGGTPRRAAAASYICAPLCSGVPGGAALEVAQDVADASALQDVPGQG